MTIRVDRTTRIAGIAGVALALSAGATLGLGPASAAAATADSVPPQGSIGGLQSPARGVLSLAVDASDDGVGLATAAALVDGTALAQVTLDVRCVAPDGTTPAAPPPAEGCVRQVSRVPLRLDVSALGVGTHRLQVRVTDAAGNAADVYDGTFAIAASAPVLTPTVQLTIGDPRATRPSPGSAVLGTGAASGCAFPRLSMVLDQRPLRISHGRLVLRAYARYRFRGTLTCRIGRERRSAPRGLAVELLNRIGSRVWGVTGATTASGGRLTVILSYRTSRTLIFRHRGSNATSAVRIPILVARRSAR